MPPGLHSGPNPLQTGQEVNTGLHFLRHPKSRECWQRISEPPLLQHRHVIFFFFYVSLSDSKKQSAAPFFTGCKLS